MTTNRAASTNATRAAGPNADLQYTGGQNAANVKDLIRRQSDASPIVKWVAAAVILALGALMVVTARSRRRARES